ACWDVSAPEFMIGSTDRPLVAPAVRRVLIAARRGVSDFSNASAAAWPNAVLVTRRTVAVVRDNRPNQFSANLGPGHCVPFSEVRSFLEDKGPRSPYRPKQLPIIRDKSGPVWLSAYGGNLGGSGMGRGGGRCRGGRTAGRRAGSGARPPDLAAGEEPARWCENPHVRWDALQHYARHRQPGYRGGVRPTRPLPALRAGGPERGRNNQLD